MNYPAELKYTKSHEWISFLDDQRAAIGLTDYAQHELGDIVFVNLPVEGDEITAGEPFADVESVKAVSDVFSPVTATICAVNDELLDAPQNINAEPYEAWLVKVENISQQEEFLSAEEYEEFIKAGRD